MQITINVPDEADARVTEAFCTDRQQEDETERECIDRLVTSYINQVVADYEQARAVRAAQEQTAAPAIQ